MDDIQTRVQRGAERLYAGFSSNWSEWVELKQLTQENQLNVLRQVANHIDRQLGNRGTSSLWGFLVGVISRETLSDYGFWCEPEELIAAAKAWVEVITHERMMLRDAAHG